MAWQGFEALFKRYDEDGSGALDLEEFRKAVRADLGMSEATMSTQELDMLFNAFDAPLAETEQFGCGRRPGR